MRILNIYVEIYENQESLQNSNNKDSIQFTNRHLFLLWSSTFIIPHVKGGSVVHLMNGEEQLLTN